MPHRHALVVLLLIAIGVVLAAVSGWLWGEAMTEVGWVGDLFLRTLKMLIVPLVIAAVISGIGALGDVRRLGRLGGITLLYYLSTTFIAVAIGLTLVNIIEPGVGLEAAGAEIDESMADRALGIQDLLLSLVSPNIIDSAAETQLLPLIVFSILFAAALTTVGSAGSRTIEFFEGVNRAMMKLVAWVMYTAPVGIFALVAARLGEAGGGAAFLAELQAVGLYVLTVLLGLAVHFGVLVVAMLTLARQPLSYLLGMLRPIAIAFGTASSSATLPVTMESATERGIGERATKFVLPLGSTVNMDGTALYEAVAVLFIAQVHGLELGLGQQILVLVTAALAAIGAAGIPEAGLVTMVIVLQAVGIPLEGIGLLLAVDWFLDRFRTAVNVWGDAVGAAVVDRLADQRPGNALESAD